MNKSKSANERHLKIDELNMKFSTLICKASCRIKEAKNIYKGKIENVKFCL